MESAPINITPRKVGPSFQLAVPNGTSRQVFFLTVLAYHDRYPISRLAQSSNTKLWVFGPVQCTEQMPESNKQTPHEGRKTNTKSSRLVLQSYYSTFQALVKYPASRRLKRLTDVQTEFDSVNSASSAHEDEHDAKDRP